MKTKLFDKILEQVKPILTNVDLGFNDSFFSLKVYHPSVLPQKSSLAIFEGQTTVDYLNDLLVKKSKQLEDIADDFEDSEDEAGTSNLEARKEKVKEITQLNYEIAQQINGYIEALAKLKPGELDQKLDRLYASLELWIEEHPDTKEALAYQNFLEYPRNKFTVDIFSEINEALTEYNQKQLNVASNATTSEKK
jgi:hypothetical protein